MSNNQCIDNSNDHRRQSRRVDDDGKAYFFLDTCGLSCPEPVMLLHGVLRDAESGERIVVSATDPSSKKDVAKFCLFLGHSLVGTEDREGVLFFEIIKGGTA